jgi:hypothetical protein
MEPMVGVAIRLRDGRRLEPVPIEDFAALVTAVVEQRGGHLLLEDAATASERPMW